MAKINLDGKAPESQFEKVKLEDKERYPAELMASRVQETDAYDKPGQKVNKLLIDFEVETKEGKHLIPMWANPRVSKGSGNFSNSKLYNVFSTMKVLDKFAKQFKDKEEITDDELSDFITEHAGTKVQVQISNSNKGTEDEYSNVSDVIKVLK